MKLQDSLGNCWKLKQITLKRRFKGRETSKGNYKETLGNLNRKPQETQKETLKGNLRKLQETLGNFRKPQKAPGNFRKPYETL